MNTPFNKEPPEKESGAPHEQDAATFTNPNNVAAVNREGLGIEGGKLVPICDGRVATEFKWERTSRGAIVDQLLATEFDDPEVAEAAMLPSELLSRNITIACWDRLTGRDSRSFTEIADSLGVTKAAISSCWQKVLGRSGLTRIYRNAAARAKSAKLSARTRDYHARAKKGKVAK